MLRLEYDNKDLGLVSLNQPKTFSVKLFNDGDVDVQVIRVKPECGACTVSRVSSATIPAHSSVDVISTFTPQSTGYNAKRITITYQESGVTSTLTLRFKAQVS